MSSPTVELQGDCAPEFKALRDAFIRNFTDHDEIGADLGVFVGGEMVVNLWGGYRDAARSLPWASDTIVCLWSATKGVIGACFSVLVDRGLAAYEDKVSKYWSEFSVAGKGDITIATLLSHQAGISGFTTPATIGDMLAGDTAAQRLAAQTPLWEPGTAAGYHGLSIGPLANYLFKLIEGRSIKQFFAEEIAGPNGLDISIGLAAADDARAAEIVASPAVDSSKMVAATAAQKALHNPPTHGSLANTVEFRRAELSSANGFGNGRALAGLYNLLLPPRANRASLARPQIIAEATRCRAEGVDLVKGSFERWSAGFTLNHSAYYGSNSESFGASGWGGSFAFADPVADISIGYAMNHMGNLMDRNPRRRDLINTLYANL